MTILARPIPPLYTVYVLRSTVRRASLYIGSTPNPPRRLRQHNGEVGGGAAKTSRNTLRPWEVVCLVEGFPGMVAALKFEWAITNPHLSLHIPSTARLAAPSSTQRKRNGQPRRTRPTVSSVVSNLHLLLRVPSFARWPLGLRFFDKEFYNAWQRWNDAVSDKVRGSLPVVTDFGPDEAAGSAGIGVGKGREGAVVKTKAGGKSAFTGKGRRVGTDAASSARDPDEAEDGVEEDEEDEGESRSWGIHAIPLDYAPMRDYVAKAQEIFAFERQGSCVSCGERLVAQSSDQAAGHDDPPPLLAVCPNAGCEAVGHLTCWGGELLDGERRAAARPFAQGGPPEASHQHVVPIEGRCPGCGGPVRWVDMMKELTLRQRGAKEVVKLLKKKRAATARVGA